MTIRITLPRDAALDNLRRLRTHAAWYKRQVARDPAYGARRFDRRRRRRDAQALAPLVPQDLA